MSKLSHVSGWSAALDGGTVAGPAEVARSAGNGPGEPGAGVAVAAARPVVLVRYRPGVAGETARTVHVVPLPTDSRVSAVRALCGTALILDDIEILDPGQGMPCPICLITQMMNTAPTG